MAKKPTSGDLPCKRKDRKGGSNFAFTFFGHFLPLMLLHIVMMTITTANIYRAQTIHQLLS